MPPDAARRRLAVSVTDEDGRPLAGGLSRWLAGVAPLSARGAVSIALVTDDRIRSLNRQYRGKNETTDVLSFPDDAKGILGDIVIATGVAARQAREQKQSYQDELRTLALHGLLHLLGYDHERDAGEMQRIEERLRIKGGLRVGLIGRDGRRKIAPESTRAIASRAALSEATARRRVREKAPRRTATERTQEITSKAALSEAIARQRVGVGPRARLNNAGRAPQINLRKRSRRT